MILLRMLGSYNSVLFWIFLYIQVVDFQFGMGERAFHIILELYAQGNNNYTILTLLRIHRLLQSAFIYGMHSNISWLLFQVYHILLHKVKIIEIFEIFLFPYLSLINSVKGEKGLN